MDAKLPSFIGKQVNNTSMPPPPQERAPPNFSFCCLRGRVAGTKCTVFLRQALPRLRKRRRVIGIGACGSAFLRTAHASHVICARGPISPSVSGAAGPAICAEAAVLKSQIPDRDNGSRCEEGRRENLTGKRSGRRPSPRRHSR